MTEIITWVSTNGVSVVEALVSIVGGFAIIATMTKNQSDDRIVQMLLDAVNFLGANFGKSKNG